jgi:nitrous oxide reductase accessory protein NosL
MRGVGRRIIALVIVGLLAAGCSSSSHSKAPRTAAPDESGTAAVQKYLSAVNALCDDLLPKVLQVIHGGHPSVYPVTEFFAELPAHTKLLADFDAQLAKVPVPPQATTQAAALSAYIRFANALDAKRLAAAKGGQAAFDKEIRDENAHAASDPTISARTAAGFNESCSAR